jgi:LasA protease
MKRYRFIFVFIAFWLVPALACSLPKAEPYPGLPSFEEALIEKGYVIATPEPTSTGDNNQIVISTEVPHPQVGIEPPQPVSIQPGPPFRGTALPAILDGMDDVYAYPAQSGDTLLAVALRFEVEPEQISSAQDIPAKALLSPGQILYIPNQTGQVPYPIPLLPDYAVVYSPYSADFDVEAYIKQAGGFLSTYEEKVGSDMLSGSQIVQRIALDTSTNPKFLLAFLEYRSQWVHGQPPSSDKERYPIGFYVSGYQGLYKELSLTAKMLGMGYYGWRDGSLTVLDFPKSTKARIAPGLNAGSAAVQFLLSKFHNQADWYAHLYGPGNFIELYDAMFGDPWEADLVLLPPGLVQPYLELPFQSGERWSYTGGPHSSWQTGTPRGALDFAPVTGEPACSVSSAWVTASAPGLVVRSERGIVILDLDGDGNENTGWALLYYHIAAKDRVPVGTWLEVDERIGHPSCEGGSATGTHVHIARKYNGEWIEADGPLPFVLSGWRAAAADRLYEGYLFKGEQVVSARPQGSSPSSIFR